MTIVPKWYMVGPGTKYSNMFRESDHMSHYNLKYHYLVIKVKLSEKSTW